MKYIAKQVTTTFVAFLAACGGGGANNVSNIELGNIAAPI